MRPESSHLKQFRAHHKANVVWTGMAPKQWATSMLSTHVSESVLNELPDLELNRQQVRDFCSHDSHSTEACFIVVMAWGGRNAKNARLAWPKESWRALVHEMRRTKQTMNRAELFNKCLAANMPGIGIAYFTKLMYFLRPENEGCYILDQWTARSANLLASDFNPQKPEIVFFQRNQQKRSVWIDPRNTGQEYEDYCQLVEWLAGKMGGISPHAVEEAMFSGGQNHPWRQHLRDDFSLTISKNRRRRNQNASI